MEAISATFPGHYSTTKQSATGRVCNMPGCPVSLSIYNHDDFCGRHRNYKLNVRTVG